ncbi:MAG: hypothetical protein DSZ28_08270 [Thiothrix sp.]|nr:MAG: hypothetical protein DSZ28_08270 [Thiothrix sp.]
MSIDESLVRVGLPVHGLVKLPITGVLMGLFIQGDRLIEFWPVRWCAWRVDAGGSTGSPTPLRMRRTGSMSSMKAMILMFVPQGIPVVRLRKARYCGIAPVLILRLPRSFEFLFRNPGLNRQPCPGDDGFVPRGVGASMPK